MCHPFIQTLSLSLSLSLFQDRLKDLVHTESLRDCLRVQLNQLEQRLTPAQVEHLTQAVDLETRQQLKAFLEA